MFVLPEYKYYSEGVVLMTKEPQFLNMFLESIQEICSLSQDFISIQENGVLREKSPTDMDSIPIPNSIFHETLSFFKQRFVSNCI